MYRVLIKVNKVNLRIKQNIQIQLAIKKDTQNIILNQKSKLDKCIATFDDQAQFFVNMNDPTFRLCVMIIFRQMKKFAGVLNMDLRKYQENMNHFVQQKLQQSPDAQSCINFEFAYMATNFKSMDKNLITMRQLQYENRKEMAQQMQDHNDFLTSQNNRLDLQLQNLREGNQNLFVNKNQMNNYYQQSMKIQDQTEKNNEEGQDYENDMKIMKDRVNRLKNLVEEHGNSSMRDQVFQFFKNQ